MIAPWEPDESLAAEGSDIKTEFLWAALDCAGAFAFTAEEGRGRPMLLGRLTGRVTGAVRANERCVVAGWRISRDGRKSVAGTAVWNEAGDLRAVARQFGSAFQTRAPEEPYKPAPHKERLRSFPSALPKRCGGAVGAPERRSAALDRLGEPCHLIVIS